MKLHNLLSVLLLVTPLAAVAGASGDAGNGESKPGSTIYKSIGPDGKVVFSDTRPAGGKVEQVEVGPTNVQPIALPRPLPLKKLSPKGRRAASPAANGPFSIGIVSPQDGATIPPGQRIIVLQVAVDPVPQGGYRFFAVVDGQPWAGGSSGDSLDISALERGSHSVLAVLTDAAGNPLAQSQAITLYVKRPGGQIPEIAGPRATPAPKAPVAPGPSKPNSQ